MMTPRPTPRRPRVKTAFVALLALPALVLVSGFAPEAQPPQVANQTAYDKTVAPVLQKYCLPCHGNNSAAGGVNLAKYKNIAEIQKDQVGWRKVVTQIRQRSMPPKGSPAPTLEERELMATWLTGTLDAADDSLIPRDPGRVLIHRLNRQEYNNTVRDLFGVTIKPADNFPADGGGGGGFDNNADTLYVPPILMERYLDAADAVLSAAIPDRVFIARPGKGITPTAAARKVVEHYAFRAYRRPVTTAEVDKLMALFARVQKRGGTYEEGVKLALKAVLVSPNFLFRVEQVRAGTEAYRLNDFELASRLSYFLWASMPDDQLLNLAKQGKLTSDPRSLEREVRRMTESRKFMEFADAFAGQWLRIRELYTGAQPDRRKFPEYTPELRDAFYSETVLFFASVMREDVSLLRFVDADYTFANETLAKHYGIPGVTGNEMRKVQLADGKRGGLLTMGSVLTLSSYPLRTSPVLRGKWLLSEFLGTPPPPPPPVVAFLSQDDGVNKEGQTFRQRLEKHRTKPECASCHSRIDPLGFGLENYDPIGRWRDKVADVAVDASGELPNGDKFAGSAELKKVLLSRKDEFLRNLVEKMLAYSLGRGLQPYDLPTVKRIMTTLEQNDYRSGVLLMEIVKSYPFQYRKNG